jgi:hypothetical protein
MNKAAKVVLTIYLVLLVFVCIYVPWRTNNAIAQGTILVDSIGYSPIWAMHDFNGAYQGATVDFGKVVLEAVALTAIFGIPFIFVYKPEEYDYIDLEDYDELPEKEEVPLERK